MKYLIRWIVVIFSAGLYLVSCATVPSEADGDLLVEAVKLDEPDLLETMLQSGIDPNSTSADGMYPRLMAVYLGNTPAVELLLDYGADPDVQAGEGSSAITLAIQEGHTGLAETLIKRGCSVTLANAKGQTPLMFASQYGMPTVAAMLLNRGADPDVHADDGATGLLFAVVFENREVVDLLLRAGADVNASNDYSQTALMAASAMGLTDLVEQLHAAGAELNQTDARGLRALHYANMSEQAQTSIYLLKAGALSEFPFTRIIVLPMDYPEEQFFHSSEAVFIGLPDHGSLFPEDIPDRVVYRKPASEEFELAVQKFDEFLRNGTESTRLFSDVLIVGAYLTKMWERIPLLEKTNPNLMVSVYDPGNSLLQKAYRNGEIIYPANYLRNRILQEGDVTLRAATFEELDWYWTIISYDLVDVIFVVETSVSRFFLEFHNGSLLYVDDWTWLKWM